MDTSSIVNKNIFYEESSQLNQNKNDAKADGSSFSHIYAQMQLQQSDRTYVEAPKSLEEKYEQEKTQRLVDDIRSVFRTGLTVSELEQLEEMIRKIQEKIKEEQTSGNSTEESRQKIDEMLSQIEQAIMELQKRVNGVAIKDMSATVVGEKTTEPTDEFTQFNTRVEEAKKAMHKLRELEGTSVSASNNNTHELLALSLQLKQA